MQIQVASNFLGSVWECGATRYVDDDGNIVVCSDSNKLIDLYNILVNPLVQIQDVYNVWKNSL